MNKDILGIADDVHTKLLYHGTQAELSPRDLIEPSDPPGLGKQRDRVTTYVYLTPNLDEAIWEAGRVSQVAFPWEMDVALSI